MSNEIPPPPSTSVVPFLGDNDESADAWTRMHRSDRRRLAKEEPRGKGAAELDGGVAAHRPHRPHGERDHRRRDCR